MSQSVDAGSPQVRGFRMPAEWERHAATWLVWPSSEDWPGKLEAVRWVFCDLILKLSVDERVRLVVANAGEQVSVTERLLTAGVELSRVDFFVARTNRSWARDNLPIFIASQAEPALLEAVKFKFNGWARYDDHQLDEAAGQHIAEAYAARVWSPELTLGGGPQRMVLEGGSIDVDGQGTLLTTEQCLLGKRNARNPGATRSEIETALGESLGIVHTVWLGDGIAGDDTSGHVDDFARFVAPGIVVCASEANPADVNYRPLKEALETLNAAKDSKGSSLQVVPLPMPAPIVFDGERLPASYANFYIANGRVLVPTFNDPQDREALGILAELFPQRNVVGVHALDLVLGLGTLHCSTQQEPTSA